MKKKYPMIIINAVTDGLASWLALPVATGGLRIVDVASEGLGTGRPELLEPSGT